MIKQTDNIKDQQSREHHEATYQIFETDNYTDANWVGIKSGSIMYPGVT